MRCKVHKHHSKIRNVVYAAGSDTDWGNRRWAAAGKAEHTSGYNDSVESERIIAFTLFWLHFYTDEKREKKGEMGSMYMLSRRCVRRQEMKIKQQKRQYVVIVVMKPPKINLLFLGNSYFAQYLWGDVGRYAKQ